MGDYNAMDELQSNDDQASGWSVSEARDQWRTNGEVKYSAFMLAYMYIQYWSDAKYSTHTF